LDGGAGRLDRQQRKDAENGDNQGLFHSDEMLGRGGN
jgi:hypothetical protein